jgi:predicted metal-dependent peptidase
MIGGKNMSVFGYTNNDIKSKLPFEHMATSNALNFFLALFFEMEIKDTEDGHFLAGVGLTPQRKLQLCVNTTLLSQFSIPEQEFVLAHEASHVIMNHLLVNRNFKSKELANIAMDAVLNSLLNRSYSPEIQDLNEDKYRTITLERLQAEGFIEQEDLDKLNKELTALTTDDVYEILERKMPKGGGSGGGNQSAKGGSKKNKNGGSSNDKDKDESSDEGEGGSQGVFEKMDKQRFDEHSDISMDDVDDETRLTIESIIQQAKNDMYGSKTADFVKQLENLVRRHFPFKEILDKILFKTKYDFSRPHRRIHVPHGYIPRRRDEKIKVYAMIDVSGSVWDYTKAFVEYIMGLDEFEELMLIDTEIKKIYRKGETPDIAIGGGGTDLNPGFEYWRNIENNNRGEKLNFVCLTDGEIPPLEVGPTRSKVLVLTTHNPINYDAAIKPYININIEKDVEK